MPDGAPECPADREGVGEPHQSRFAITESLSDGGIIVRIDGNILQEGVTPPLQIGRSYNVSIERTLGPFRGILWRIGSGLRGSDTAAAVSVNDNLLKVSQPCLDASVGGVTHTSNEDKDSVSFTMTLDTLDIEMPIDLTVVISIEPSEFYYSQLRVSPRLPFQPDPTMSPVTNAPTRTFQPTTTTRSPTEPPSTAMPSNSPTRAPISPPTAAPSRAPTSEPTFATLEPTDTPPTTIFDLIVSLDLTLVDYVQLGGEGFRPIIDTEEGSLTLFAPANQAFESLHPRLVSWLRSDVFALVQTFLLGHMAGENLALDDLRTRESLVLLDGSERRVDLTPNGDVLVGGAKILDADLRASNGVVHTINRVLTIPTLEEYLFAESPVLLDYLVQTDLLGVLRDTFGVTIFSPPAAAITNFSASFPDLGEVIFTEPSYGMHLYGLLAIHCAEGMYFQSDLRNGQSLQMLAGDSHVVAINSGIVTLSSNADVVENDGVTLEAIVHKVDALLTPRFLGKSLADVISESTPTFSSLVVLAELESNLTSVFGVTVFAPTDQAFNKLGETNLVFLQSDEARVTLKSLLGRHIMLGTFPSTIISEGTATLQTLDPDTSLTVTKNGDTLVVNNTATVVETDVLANNGIIHLIDTVLSLNVADTPTVSPPDEVPTITPTTNGIPQNDRNSASASGSKPFWYSLWYCSFVFCSILWGWSLG